MSWHNFKHLTRYIRGNFITLFVVLDAKDNTFLQLIKTVWCPDYANTIDIHGLKQQSYKTFRKKIGLYLHDELKRL